MFFNDTATTEIYTLTLHDALPISKLGLRPSDQQVVNELRKSTAFFDPISGRFDRATYQQKDRKSTRLNSSHANISYAVFCLKKKRFSGIFFLLFTLFTLALNAVAS